MAFSESFLAWEQQTEERIKQRVEQEVRQRVEQEVRQEELNAIAINMFRNRLQIEMIAEVTGLTMTQLQELQLHQAQE